MATVVLRGATDQLLDDLERAVDDGVNTYKVSRRMSLRDLAITWGPMPPCTACNSMVNDPSPMLCQEGGTESQHGPKLMAIVGGTQDSSSDSALYVRIT